MNPIIIRASRRRQITPLLICLGVLIVGLPSAIKNNATILQIVLIIIFGGGALYFIRQLWKAPKQLIIDDEGIWHAGWMINQVRWNELRAAYVKSAGPKEYLCFTANDREELRQRMSALGRTINDASRAADLGDFSLNTTDYSFSSQEVVEFANKKIAES